MGRVDHRHGGVGVSGGYDGQLLATWHAVGGVTIDVADPRIVITAAFLREMCPDQPIGAMYPGDMIRLLAVNRTVIYRIDAVTPSGDYLASWPD
jgi:hypothetical protein